MLFEVKIWSYTIINQLFTVFAIHSFSILFVCFIFDTNFSAEKIAQYIYILEPIKMRLP